MDNIVTVSHVDSYRSLFDFFKDTLVDYTIPSYMKMSHVVQELQTIVLRPHACIYDGLLGLPNEAGELCERIASHRNTTRASHVEIFVPLLLENWVIHHLVTIHLHFGTKSVMYYDPKGTRYEAEMRHIVGLQHNGETVTLVRFIEILMRSLPGWSFDSVGVWQQGFFSPLSCGRFNLQYIRGCLQSM